MEICKAIHPVVSRASTYGRHPERFPESEITNLYWKVRGAIRNRNFTILRTRKPRTYSLFFFFFFSFLTTDDDDTPKRYAFFVIRTKLLLLKPAAIVSRLRCHYYYTVRQAIPDCTRRYTEIFSAFFTYEMPSYISSLLPPLVIVITVNRELVGGGASLPHNIIAATRILCPSLAHNIM